MKKLALLLMLSVAFAASAQHRAVDENGNTVRRLKFDRENVTVVYGTGDSTNHLQSIAITRQSGSTVGIVEPSPIESDGEAMYYDLNGRPMKVIDHPGVYIEKRGKKVRKIVVI